MSTYVLRLVFWLESMAISLLWFNLVVTRTCARHGDVEGLVIPTLLATKRLSSSEGQMECMG